MRSSMMFVFIELSTSMVSITRNTSAVSSAAPCCCRETWERFFISASGRVDAIADLDRRREDPPPALVVGRVYGYAEQVVGARVYGVVRGLVDRPQQQCDPHAHDV